MTNKKKALFITPLPPPIHGSSVVSQYIKESKLINEAFDCDFVNLSTSRRLDEIGKTMPVKLVRFVSVYFRVFGKLLFRKYDFCYLAITCHGIGFLKDAPFVLMCKLFKKRIMIHQHNKGMYSYIDKSIYKWLLPLVYRKTKVILLSWKLYPDIEPVVKKEQIIICPNGIPEKNDEQTISKNRLAIPKLLFLSNLNESKGIWVLLDTCRILKQEGYQFICDIIGGETKEISTQKLYEEIKKRDLQERITYHGRKYGKEKNNYFLNADIFVSPTLNDCFPLVLIEAMQHGLPVETTSEGAIEDNVIDGKNGLICLRDDAQDLADKIKILLTNKQRGIELGSKGTQIYKEKYTLGIFEHTISNIFSHEQ